MWIHLLACARPVVEVTPGDDPVNVATVTVDMDSTLEWGLDTSYGHKAAISDSYDLLGLLADTRYHVRAVTPDGRTSDDVAFRTNPLPEDLPALEIEGADDPDAPYTLWSISVADQDLSAVYLLDPDAGIRWYHLTDGLVLAAHATLDGAGVAIQVSRVAGEEAGDATTLDIVPWSGDALVLDHPLGHHDFVELPDGTFAAIVEVQGKFEGRAVIGDAIEILDRDGGRRELWNAFGSVRLEKNEGWTLDPADWTHANGIDYSPDRDLFALSLFRQQQVVLFDSDAAPHGLFGAEGDWTIQDDPGFGPQHGPRFTEDGLSLFDNAGAGASRWVSYALGAGTADPIAEVGEPWGDQSLVGGDGLERKDGSVVTTWGDLGYLLTTSSEGEVLRVVRTRPTGLAGRVGTLDDPF